MKIHHHLVLQGLWAPLAACNLVPSTIADSFLIPFDAAVAHGTMSEVSQSSDAPDTDSLSAEDHPRDYTVEQEELLS